jgi:Domain of unknown function (DUF4954)/Domain of unknown function (DUF6819)
MNSGINEKNYRQLSELEIQILESNGNISEDWINITVKDGFDPVMIKNSSFKGKIQIGIFTNKLLVCKNVQLPTGIYNSMLISSNVGDNCAVHNAGYISGYTIESNVLIFNIHELSVSDNPHFGNGFLNRNGSRNWISVINESGLRKILPFHSMETGDCHLWAKFRGDKELMSRFVILTDALEKSEKNNLSWTGARVGSYSVLRSCKIIRDTNFGPHSQISGVSHLENITINSSREIPSVIGEDADLINGIAGYGVEISHGARAKDFIIANHSTLKYGANLFNSFLGENSTVSCCEVNSTMVLPFHEQHHNNSFLIASLLKGQSNIGAGSTIGSNHNSRSADGEISAGRGFWTALSSSTKHNCSFASFTILAKNDFLHEMKVPTPFSLISLDHNTSYLQIMPAYWFMHNMYALTRNSWKFLQRDKRADKSIIIETEYLAPDTVEEIFEALDYLEKWTVLYGKECREACINQGNKGKTILQSENLVPDLLEIESGILEYSNNPVRILKPAKAYRAYREMIVYYSIKVLCKYAAKENLQFPDLKHKFQNCGRSPWINVGGQLIHEDDFNTLIGDIKDKKIDSWDEIHTRYRELSNIYSLRKAAHAFASLQDLYPEQVLDKQVWNKSLKETLNINRKINKSIHESKMKDHTNIFRHITFSSKEEGEAVLGNIKENSFLIASDKDEAALKKLIKNYIIEDDK